MLTTALDLASGKGYGYQLSGTMPINSLEFKLWTNCELAIIVLPVGDNAIIWGDYKFLSMF